MPTLEWIGKDKVVNHHLDVPYRVLERQYSFDENGQHSEDNGSDNMIIHGNNLEALKALLPQYEGRVKCIYIDPPYNTANSTTANQRWVYSDNVDYPELRKWIGQVVGDEGEDLSRHDKWLCMMYPRLKLLQRLLSDDGAIFISIDDNECSALKTICDEIFGRQNFVSNIAWQKTYSPRNDSKGIPYETDSILVYSKKHPWIPRKLARTTAMDERHGSPDGDPVEWQSGDVSAAGSTDHQGMVYAIQQPITGKLIYPAAGRHWKDEQQSVLAIMNEWAPYELRDIDDAETRAQLCNIPVSEVRAGVKAVMLSIPQDEAHRIALQRYNQGNWPPYYFTSNGQGGIRFKNHIKEDAGKAATNLWPYAEVGHTDGAKKELKAIFDGIAPFETPKPTRLIDRILQIATDPDSIVLDSFAGSGTTAHSVLKANQADNGTRRFILIEMMDYAETIVAERMRRVIGGYTSLDDVEELVYDVELTLDNLTEGTELLTAAKTAAKEAKKRYDKVSKPKIEDGHLQVVGIRKNSEEIAGTGGNFSYYELGEPLMVGDVLNENVGVEKIREYVYFTDTKSRLPEAHPDEPYYMGIQVNSAYYFYYEKQAVTTLNREFLHTVKTKADAYVIYADLCTLSDAELEKYHITFKKIPRDITKL